MGVSPQVGDVHVPIPLRWLPHRLWLPWFVRTADRETCAPPWPHLVIGAGPLGTSTAGMIKRLSGAATFAVACGQPISGPEVFDVIIDPLAYPGSAPKAQSPKAPTPKSPNILTPCNVPHGLTPDVLRTAGASLQAHLAGAPRPWIVVLIGDEF